MGRIIQPTAFAGLTPEVVKRKYKTSEAIIAGSPVVFDANGELTLCGADPSVVDGIALEAAGSTPGYNLANDSDVVTVTGRVQEIAIAIANRFTRFSSRMEDGSGNIVTPTQTHIDEEYGITKDSAGEWYVDTSKTGASARVRIVDFDDLGTKMVVWKFLEANIASN